VVPELELFDADHPPAELRGETEEGGGAESAEADDDDAVCHVQQCRERTPFTSIETYNL
jgi:hypothetical protein